MVMGLKDEIDAKIGKTLKVLKPKGVQTQVVAGLVYRVFAESD